MGKSLGLYIHIPFCAAKCAYCDFYSLPHSEAKMDAYVGALCRHLRTFAPRAADYTVDTVYFGGGTPSYLGAERLTAVLDTVTSCFHMDPRAEITLEANPDSACADLSALRRAGFNRVSLGVQSSDDHMLRRIGRIHTWAQVRQAVDAIRDAGFDNLSLDLIYGLPEQTMEQWQRTLSDAVSLAPDHVSAYGLKLEPGTPLWRRQTQLTFPDDDQQAEMYLNAVTFFAKNGYFQYEISNFARPGFASRHNLKYWRLEEYAGFGPGAHSDFGGVRYAAARDLDGYIAGRAVLSERTVITPAERAREYVMLSLRTAEGLSPAVLEGQYGVSFAPLEALMRTYQAHALAEPVETGWCLTPRGFLVSNAIIGQLLDALDGEETD